MKLTIFKKDNNNKTCPEFVFGDRSFSIYLASISRNPFTEDLTYS